MKYFMNFQCKGSFFVYLLILFLICGLSGMAYGGDDSNVPNTFSSGTTAKSSEVNANFDYLEDRCWDLNGSNLYYNSGNVGIGTTNPEMCPTCTATTLEIEGENAGIAFDDTTSGSKFGIFSNENELRITSMPDTFPDSYLILDLNGNVGIGTTSPNYTLHINGTIGTTNSGQVHSDYVFEPGYKLRNLEELESFIKDEQHLPGVITDPEKAPNVDLLSLNGKLLEKIEELTLYVIEQNKKIKAQDTALKSLEEKFANLEGKMSQ